jgi:Tol biopolymer transport system component
LTNTPRTEQEFAAEINFDQITASPDGKSIAFAYRESPEHKGSPIGGWDIYVLDIEACQGLENGCDAQRFTRLTGEPFDEISPAWAPDGSLIAFTSGQELFVMQTDGSSQTRIIGNQDLPDRRDSLYQSGIYYPAWSPDSQKIVFTASTQDRHADTFVYTANGDGSDVRQLTFLPHEENMHKQDWYPQWSPDGTEILFESNREPPGLYVMNSDGSELMYVADGWFPRWSPDGTMIASGSHSGIVLLERDNGYTVGLSLGHVRSYEWIK